MKSKRLQWLKNKIERILGFHFRNKTLLNRALTHSSCIQHRKNKKSNETMEFLGDAVLELIVREQLYKKFPKLREGQLSELKKNYTSEDALHSIGKKLSIGQFLSMDHGEELSGGRSKKTNIAGCLEALIGAIYLDQGITAARRFIKQRILKRRITHIQDFKSLVNNWAMRNRANITYRVTKEEGPAHRKIFHVTLYVNRRKKSAGEGQTKKNAEQIAAAGFLKTLTPHLSPSRKK